MKEVFGNLWDFEGIHCITTNGSVKKIGLAVMGRGCAKEASIKYPQLPRELGVRLQQLGNQVHYFSQYKLITFPVKHVWWDEADLCLIGRSARELLKVIEEEDLKENVYLPRPGCGYGGLLWKGVKLVIEPIFRSNQIRIVTFQ